MERAGYSFTIDGQRLFVDQPVKSVREILAAAGKEHPAFVLEEDGVELLPRDRALVCVGRTFTTRARMET